MLKLADKAISKAVPAKMTSNVCENSPTATSTKAQAKVTDSEYF